MGCMPPILATWRPVHDTGRVENLNLTKVIRRDNKSLVIRHACGIDVVACGTCGPYAHDRETKRTGPRVPLRVSQNVSILSNGAPICNIKIDDLIGRRVGLQYARVYGPVNVRYERSVALTATQLLVRIASWIVDIDPTVLRCNSKEISMGRKLDVRDGT